MSFLRLRDVSVRFGPYLALDGVSLDVARGEVVTLIGHSGCGKSALLNLVAGLNRPTSGGILCSGAPLLEPGPDRGVVFQNHSLPLGALDALTRASLQDELLGIVDGLGATVLMVTHDVDEAILLSDRVVMMTNGPAARLGEILAIDLPRPRDRLAIAADPACVAYRQAMIRFLHGKHRRADA